MMLAATLLVGLLTPVAARLCADGVVVTDGAVCEQEGRFCGGCRCSSSGAWVCDNARDGDDEEQQEDDCTSIDFRKGECTDWQEGRSCGDCTCVARKWVCGVGGTLEVLVSEEYPSQERKLQISDEACQAINERNDFEECTEAYKICGNCICDEEDGGASLRWRCARGVRSQQCLGVENGKFCRWIERGETCGDCECMPNNRWSCPAASSSFCDEVDDAKSCRWKDRGSVCGTCFCVQGFWRCPETLCYNIFPGKFCLWRNRGRTCFGCECIDNRWVCPETTPTRQELCADEIFTGKFCRFRDEGRLCGACVCSSVNEWVCPPEPCSMIDSCSGEQTIEVSAQRFDLVSLCRLPAGLRGLELIFEDSAGSLEFRIRNAERVPLPGFTSGEIVVGSFIESGAVKLDYTQDPDLYPGESPGTDQVERNIANPISTATWNPDFPDTATVYGYEVQLFGSTAGISSATLTYRWTCNEDPALACSCALE